MLTREEKVQLSRDLGDFLGLSGDIRTLINNTFAPNHQPILIALPTSLASLTDQSEWLIEYCMSSRWSRTPALLESLLNRLVSVGGIGRLVPVLARVRSRIDPFADIFDARWVLANQPFLNRKAIRPVVQQWIERPEQPILRVNGPKGSGKTYTQELLAYVMEKGRPDLHLAEATVEEGNGPSYEATELAENLTLAMNVDEPLPTRNTSSYPAALCRWVIRNTLRSPGTWILTLDGFGQRDITREVTELVQNLAKQIMAPEIARRIRMVLVDFDQPLSGNWRAKTLDDNLQCPSLLSAGDLVECLSAYNDRMQRDGTPAKMIESAEIDILAKAILDRAPADPSERLRGIYRDLVDMAQMRPN